MLLLCSFGMTPPVRLCSNGGVPSSLDGNCFFVARPWRHCGADRDERFDTIAAELEMRARRNADRDAGTYLDDLFEFAELSPHAPIPRSEIPDLLDRAMGDRFRDSLRRQCKCRQPPRESWHSTRTSDPSGAMTSGSALTRLVSKRIVTSAGTDDRLSCDTLVLCSEIWVRDRGRSLMEEDSAHAHTSYFRGQTHQTNAPNRGRVAADMI